MPGFRSIVCPVDFSDHSVQALRYAVGLAGRDRASLTVVTVNDPLLVDASEAAELAPDYVEKETEKELRAMIASVVPAGAAWAPALQLAIRTGKPEAEILACAAERGADLIVMGTHGLSGYRKLFFGSVTERVLRQTAMPVLAVPLTARASVTLTADKPVIRIGVVMVPVDLGAGSEQQVVRAATLAQHFGASLIIVHVLVPARTGLPFGPAATARERRQHDQARDELARFAARAGSTVSVVTQVLSGRPAEEIAKLAPEREADLIVIGLTGEGATAGRPGSVAYRVLTLAPVAVLALP